MNQFAHNGRGRPARTGLAVIAALGFLVTACGGDDDEAETAGSAETVSDTGTAESTEVVDTEAPEPTEATVPSDGTGSDSSVASSESAPPSSMEAPAIDPTPGPGVADDTISVGLTVQTRPAGEAAGVADSTSGDDIEIADAIIAHINSQGGIAGRQVVPVYYDRQGLSTQTPAQRTQERCATFTEDNQVIAGYYQNIANETDVACLVDAGGMFVLTGGVYPTFFDRQTLSERGNLLWGLDSPVLDDLFEASIAMLDEQGFFGDGAKVGIVYQDSPGMKRAIENSLAPALEGLGLAIDGDAPTTPADDPATFGQALAEIETAAVRFKSDGITHVLVLDGRGGVLAGPFMSAAEKQDYHPAYVLNSTSGGVETNLLTGEALAPQLANAVYLGWGDRIDGHGSDNNEFVETCLGIVRDAGVAVADREFIAMQMCDFLFFLKAGFDAAEAINADGFAAAVEQLDPIQFSTADPARFGEGRRALADQITLSTYDLDCQAAGGDGCWVATDMSREL